MSEKIKVGNAEVEKANYDYFLLMYEKMPKEYIVADLVSKCEDYGKLYKNYEMKDLQIEEKDKEIERLNKQIEEYQKALDETTSEKVDLENIIKEVRKYITGVYDSLENVDRPIKLYEELLEILDKDNKE